MRRARHVGGSVRPEDEQARRFAPACEHRQQVDGGRVAPVQVFQNQDERRVVAEHVERFDELSQHPLARRPLDAPLHGARSARAA